MEPIDLTESDIQNLTQVFRTLSDPSRLRIIEILSKDETVSVSEIAERVNLSVSSVSHQLGKMRDRGVVDADKVGRRAIYRIKDECIHSILRRAKVHVRGK